MTKNEMIGVGVGTGIGAIGSVIASYLIGRKRGIKKEQNETTKKVDFICKVLGRQEETWKSEENFEQEEVSSILSKKDDPEYIDKMNLHLGAISYWHGAITSSKNAKDLIKGYFNN